MLIEVGNVHAKVLQAHPRALDWLRGYLVTTVFGRNGKPRSETLVRDRCFPAGFCGFVREAVIAMSKDIDGPAWARNEKPIRFVDRRAQVGQIVDADTSWLRGYQQDAVEAILATQRGIIKAPTAAGKTEVISALLMRVVGMRWLVIAPRTQLASAAARRYLRRKLERQAAADPTRAASNAELIKALEQERLDNVAGHERVGFVGSSRWDVEPEDTIVFATFQSLYASLNGRGQDLLESAGGLIIDEGHTSGAKTYAQVIEQTINARWRVSFSATPLDRTDGRNAVVIGATGRVIYEIPVPLLIKLGVFARPRVIFARHDTSADVPSEEKCKACKGKGEEWSIAMLGNIPCTKCQGAGTTTPKYATVEDEAITKSAARNDLIVKLAAAAERPCIVFVKRALQGKRIAKQLAAALGGVDVRFIDQATSIKLRDQAVQQIRSGELELVVASKVWAEGIDAPNIATIVNARGGKSAINVLQQLGRGSRVSETKKTFTYIDILDAGNAALQRHARARMRLLEGELGVKVEVVG